MAFGPAERSRPAARFARLERFGPAAAFLAALVFGSRARPAARRLRAAPFLAAFLLDRRSLTPGTSAKRGASFPACAGAETEGGVSRAPHPLPPPAMSAPAASRAASRPAFPHRTRRRSAPMQAKARPSRLSPRC